MTANGPSAQPREPHELLCNAEGSEQIDDVLKWRRVTVERFCDVRLLQSRAADQLTVSSPRREC